MALSRSRSGEPARPETLIARPAAREVVPQDPRYSTRWHCHDYPSPIARWNHHPEYELHLITRGTGRFIVGDRIGNFAAGQLVLVGPDLPHHWISDLGPGESLPGRDVVLQFRDQWIQACVDVMPELADLRPLLANSVRGIEFLGATARQGAVLLAEIGATTGTTRVATTLSLLATLAAAPPEDRRYLANEWLPELDTQASRDVVNKTLDYIFTNLDTDVRLSVAARMIGMSDSAFSRYFKRASGHTFGDMVKKARIAHACKLLDTTDEPVSSIAHAIGYRNLSNFNRQFLAEKSVTPSEYRRRAARSLRAGTASHHEPAG